jgi:hypothetical protein
MKLLLLVCFSLLSLQAFAQEEALSHLSLSTKVGDSISAPIPTEGVIVVREGTQDFHAHIRLFPIVPNKDAEDSLEQENKPLILTLDGKFPVDNFDFLTTADNAKQYTMNVTAHLYDSTIVTPLSVIVSVPQDRPDDGGVYPAHLTFLMILDPKQFGLGVPPFDMHDLVMIQVADALINKWESAF